jgi:hypothetical protein
MRINRLTCAFLCAGLLSLCFISARAQEESDTPFMLRNAAAKLKTLTGVSSSAVGFGLQPGEFFLLSQDFLKYGSVPYFKELLQDEKAVVRVMGLVCLAQSLSRDEYAEIAEAYKDDAAEVRYMKGCIDSSATVGRIAEWLKDDPYFFGRESGKLPSLKN